MTPTQLDPSCGTFGSVADHHLRLHYRRAHLRRAGDRLLPASDAAEKSWTARPSAWPWHCRTCSGVRLPFFGAIADATARGACLRWRRLSTPAASIRWRPPTASRCCTSAGGVLVGLGVAAGSFSIVSRCPCPPDAAGKAFDRLRHRHGAPVRPACSSPPDQPGPDQRLRLVGQPGHHGRDDARRCLAGDTAVGRSPKCR